MTGRREVALAWTADALAVAYFAWRGATLFRIAGTFQAMFRGLGADVPPATHLVVDHRALVLSVAFGLPALLVLGKELVISDKRTSVMITMLVVIGTLLVGDMLVAANYLPLFDMINKLSATPLDTYAILEHA
jgi:hypothetical protein